MNIGELIDHYQEWVDYDMKRYGKISDETNRDIEEAGLQIVKDKYGDYEVIVDDIVHNYDKLRELSAEELRPFVLKHNSKCKMTEGIDKKVRNFASRDDFLWLVSSLLRYEDWYNDDVEFHTELHKDGSNWICPKYPLSDNDARRVTGYIEDILVDRYDMNRQDFKVIEDKYSGWTILFKESKSFNESLKEPLKGENGWIKRWKSLDKYYKGDLVISKISSPYEAWHIEKVAPNGRTIKHLGNYKSLEVAMDAAEQYLIKNESKSIENNVVPDESLEASKSRTFIELPEFQKLWQKFNLTDDDLMSLQNQIINGNQAVSLGSNVYKIRFSPKQISKGKDTTDRVIYIDYIIDSKVYLVTIFSKSDESNLTKDELNNIRKLSKSLEVK